MLRRISVVLIVLALLGCENKTENEFDTPPAGIATAAIEYQGVSYELVGVGECGARPDGTYSTWAFTLDENGEPLLQGPQLHALSDADWSVIDFLPDSGASITRIYREGTDKFGFKDGVLEFEGELGADNSEMAHVKIICPE